MSKPARRGPLGRRRMLGSTVRHGLLVGFSMLSLLPIYFMP
jgi:hypothetical protein